MKPKPSIHLTSDQIETAVRAIYSRSGYVVLSQVRNGTGYARAARTADVLAISTWPSRGLYAEAIEIKCTVSDLHRELENPKKADEIAKYCRHFWLAVPKGMNTTLAMLPPTWGVIEVDEKLKGRVAKAAGVLSPVPMDTLFVCSALRNFAESHVPLRDIENRVQAEVRVATSNHNSYRDSRVKELEAGYASFKEATGIDLLSSNGHPIWGMKDCGKAVKLLMSMRSQPLSEILKAKEHLSASMAAIDAAATVLDDSPRLDK